MSVCLFVRFRGKRDFLGPQLCYRSVFFELRYLWMLSSFFFLSLIRLWHNIDTLLYSWLTALPLGVSYSEEADDEPNNDTNTAAADNELGYYKCDVCNVTSSSFSAHNVHIKAHDNTIIIILMIMIMKIICTLRHMQTQL